MIKCSECGNEISDQAPACPRCGIPISRPPAPSKGTNTSSEKGRTTRIVTSVICGVVVAISVSVGMFYISSALSRRQAANELMTELSCMPKSTAEMDDLYNEGMKALALASSDPQSAFDPAIRYISREVEIADCARGIADHFRSHQDDASYRQAMEVVGIVRTRAERFRVQFAIAVAKMQGANKAKGEDVLGRLGAALTGLTGLLK